MAKPRKMLGDFDAPYIRSLMELIETQSRPTIASWCVDYARARLLPLWERDFPADTRPADALQAARAYLNGVVKLAKVKERIAGCRSAAREAEGFPIAQGAARTIDASASAAHNPASSLSLALYGALTLAYDQAGMKAPWETLEAVAAAECAKMELALRAVAVKDEPNPAKINWFC